MPDFTTPEDWTDGELVRAAKLNRQLRDNFLWLKSRPFDNVTMTSIINTTSTSFVEVTGSAVTIVTTGGNMFIAACGINDNSTSGATNTWDLAIDGTRLGHATTGLASMRAAGVQYADNVNLFVFTTTPPSAGSHIFSAYWKVSTGTGSALARVFAIEIR